MILELHSLLDVSSAEYGSCLLRRKFKWKLGRKPSNPIKKIEKENQKTNKNILTP